MRVFSKVNPFCFCFNIIYTQFYSANIARIKNVWYTYCDKKLRKNKMNYIVLDMEWNQPGYSDVILCRNGQSMKNEIIQIGAVKLSESLEKLGVFECIVKPVSLTSMNRTIKQLTGITDEMLSRGESFKEATERFRSFCGEDFVFLIWGYDDVRILKNNLLFHGLDSAWLGKSYNLQMIFSGQSGLERRQYSLSFALEYFEIKTEEHFHDALNDAEYTCLVCRHLDIAEGIKNLDTSAVSESVSKKKSNVLTKRKFKYIKTREEIWKNGFIVRPTCPCCGEKMKFERPKRIGSFKINIEAHCEKDGDFMVALKISETPNGTFSVNQQIYVLDEAARKYLEEKKRKKRHSNSSSRTKKHPSDTKESKQVTNDE